MSMFTFGSQSVKNWELKDERRWRKAFSEAFTSKVAQDAAWKNVGEAATILHDSQRDIASSWTDTGAIYARISKVVKLSQGNAAAVATVGPGVGATSYVDVAEGGRKVGAKVPPYGERSRLIGWASRRGLPTEYTFMKRLAIGISDRGLPNLAGNPRWKYEPPTFVWRSYMNNKNEVDDLMEAVGGEMVVVWVKRA